MVCRFESGSSPSTVRTGSRRPAANNFLRLKDRQLGLGGTERRHEMSLPVPFFLSSFVSFHVSLFHSFVFSFYTSLFYICMYLSLSPPAPSFFFISSLSLPLSFPLVVLHPSDGESSLKFRREKRREGKNRCPLLLIPGRTRNGHRGSRFRLSRKAHERSGCSRDASTCLRTKGYY